MAALARLIGQTDPFAIERTHAKAQPQAGPRQPAPQHQPQQYEPDEAYEADSYEPEPERPAGPPPWMQRANARTQPPAPQYDDEADYQPSPVHPLHRYAQQPAAPVPPPQPQYQHQDEQQYAEQQYAEEQPADPSRYDDALYGQIESAQDYQREPAYPDDPYAYQGAYDEEAEEPPRKRGGMIMVAGVLVLAVLGTGAAFAYRSFIGSQRSGEPPVIRADNRPTKIVPAQADTPKAPDRMTFGDGNEKIVPREETPVDINARSGPRVVFPPLNQNANPPPAASVSPNAPMPPAAGNGTLPNNEPRRIRTLSVKGDAADAGMPAGGSAGAARPALPAQVAAPRAPAATAAPSRSPPSSANASANAPLSIAPGAPEPAEQPARVAAVNPTEPAAPASTAGFVVQVSSQKSEADAQASYRVLQGKYGTVLGSRSPVIKRVDLTDKGKGIVYRAYAGPFATNEQASRVCTDLKAAGLSDCYIHKN